MQKPLIISYLPSLQSHFSPSLPMHFSLQLCWSFSRCWDVPKSFPLASSSSCAVCLGWGHHSRTIPPPDNVLTGDDEGGGGRGGENEMMIKMMSIYRNRLLEQLFLCLEMELRSTTHNYRCFVSPHSSKEPPECFPVLNGLQQSTPSDTLTPALYKQVVGGGGQ